MSHDDKSRFLDDLYLFYRYYVTEEKFGEDAKPAKHIKKLSRELMALNTGDLNKHLAVSMPPRHSKSSLITIAYSLWLIFQNKNLNILIVTNTYDLAETFGIDIKEFVSRFGSEFDVYLSNVKHSNTHLKFCDKEGNLYNGSIKLTGSSGSITGRDADYIIVDDPYKGEEDEFTPTALKKKINWFLRIIIQRIEPKTKLLVLHTRWHSSDIIGYIQKELSEDFKFVTFPAILEDNTPLWPEQYTIEELQKRLKIVGERLFSAIWQQKPLDDTSDFFDIDNLNYTGFLPGEHPLITVRSWDIAKGAKLTADYTVGAKMVLTNFGRIGVTDIIRGHFGLKTNERKRNENKKKILETAKKDGFETLILIETGVAAAGDLLFEEWEDQLEGFRVHQMHPIKSKVDRATPLQNSILDDELFLDLHNAKIVQAVNDEFKSFPDGINDDIIDAIAYGVIYLKRRFKGNPYTETNSKYDVSGNSYTEKKESFTKRMKKRRV